MISLRDQNTGELVAAEWISCLFDLGRKARIYAENHPSQCLVVVLSLPTRVYAAVLLAAGWVSKMPDSKMLVDVLDINQLHPGETVRFICADHVVSDVFRRLEDGVPKRAYFENECRMVDKIEMLVGASSSSKYSKGKFRCANIFVTSEADRKALMRRALSEKFEVSILGVKKSLESQMSTEIFSSESGRAQSLESLLMTNLESGIGSLTNIGSSRKIEIEWERAKDSSCLILDQPSVFSYLSEAASPVVFVIDDRTGVENSELLDLKSYFSWFTRADLRTDLIWHAAPGVEAFGMLITNE